MPVQFRGWDVKMSALIPPSCSSPIVTLLSPNTVHIFCFDVDALVKYLSRMDGGWLMPTRDAFRYGTLVCHGPFVPFPMWAPVTVDGLWYLPTSSLCQRGMCWRKLSIKRVMRPYEINLNEDGKQRFQWCGSADWLPDMHWKWEYFGSDPAMDVARSVW